MTACHARPPDEVPDAAAFLVVTDRLARRAAGVPGLDAGERALGEHAGAPGVRLARAGVPVGPGGAGVGQAKPATPVVLSPAVPVLRVFSVEKAREFYLGFLGLAPDWEHRFDARAPLYMQVSRGGLVLHLSEHHGDACPGATVRVRVAGVEALAAELAARDYPYARPAVARMPWGERLLEVADPFGNRLRFHEPDAATAPA